MSIYVRDRLRRIHSWLLTEEQVQQLLKNMAGHPVAPIFAGEVYRHTEGNPFFIGEVVRSLHRQAFGCQWLI